MTGLRLRPDQGERLDGAGNVGRARTALPCRAGVAGGSTTLAGTNQRKDASDDEVGRPYGHERHDDVLCDFRHDTRPSGEAGQ